MERKILFKAKRLSDGQWVKGYYYEECGNTYIIEDRQEESMLNRNHPYPVDPSTVCQFTGLKDKNGKDVWEHDILTDTDDGTIGEVTFGGGAFAIDCLPLSEYIYDGVLDLAVVYSKFDRKEGK